MFARRFPSHTPPMLPRLDTVVPAKVLGSVILTAILLLSYTAKAQYVYVANNQSYDVSEYEIERGGTLTPIGTIAAGRFPISIAVDPTGHYVYVG